MAIIFNAEHQHRVVAANIHYYEQPTVPLYLDRTLEFHDFIYVENGQWLFTEENNDTLSTIKLLKRKLLRRYGDFSFKMIEWEANMTIENSGAFMPELFVKILSPKEELRIVASFANDKEEQIALKVPKHLLICSEKLFSKRYIGMPHFVENLRMYKFDYPGNEVWFTPYRKYTDKMTT